MSSHSDVHCRHGKIKPLTVEECRAMMGWHDKPDREIEEFLLGLRRFIGRFLDEYFRDAGGNKML
ncbi:MAG: hypothetical protein V1926_02530 [Candidatus Peregrinibacteria bacterium]